MAQGAEPRRSGMPPPSFPPRRPALFATTPPALFPPILGLLGLATAARLALSVLGLPVEVIELVAGVAVALWAFAALAYGAKILRRPSVVLDDLRVLPGRSGLAALCMGGMAAASLIAPYRADAALGLLALSLVGHAVLAGLLIRLLISLPPAAREVNPTWHLSFVGFIVAAPPLIAMGWESLARGIFWMTLPVAGLIWFQSGMQALRVLPTAPLRPLLVIHLAPAGLLSTVAFLLSKTDVSQVLLMFGAISAAILLVRIHWLVESGPTPIWGAFTFPLAALATAMLVNGGDWVISGVALTAAALVAIPGILLWMLKRWPGGRLAKLTNAAEA